MLDTMTIRSGDVVQVTTRLDRRSPVQFKATFLAIDAAPEPRAVIVEHESRLRWIPLDDVLLGLIARGEDAAGL